MYPEVYTYNKFNYEESSMNRSTNISFLIKLIADTIETKAKTASAIIIKSVDAAFIGDKVSIVTN